MKPQVCIIHGGNTYDFPHDFLLALAQLELKYDRMLYTRRWKDWLGETLTDYDIILPEMPNKSNAKYDQWAMMFDKVVPFLKEDVILVGHSLGGIFLAKYLEDHADTLHVKKVAFVAAAYDDESDYSLGSFRLAGDMSRLATTADEFAIFHSTDDKVVPVHEADKFKKILPNAQFTILEDRGHFNVPEFPELLKFIKK